MATKQITDLNPATAFEEGDLLLVRKSGAGVDEKIEQTVFIKSIGNPAVFGFTASDDGNNQLTLTPSNESVIDTYYDKMRVGFVSPIDSTGVVSISIGELDYKNFKSYDDEKTVSLVEDQYYEAVYFEDNDTFYQINADVSEEIDDLESVDVFTDNDSLLVRNNQTNDSQLIGKENFIKSIGNSGVQGFTATSANANEVILTPANLAVVNEYYDGMKIGFISPINSNGVVEVKIGDLEGISFLQYDNGSPTVKLVNDAYYEGVYSESNSAFYQTNGVTPTIYTSEYIAVGAVAQDQQTTTYVLTSAFGSTKKQYYKGMSLLFTVDIASKGTVFVNVDGLGNKLLNDGPNDGIANDLYQGQTLIAIYDGTQFVKNKFEVANEPLPILPIEDEEAPPLGYIENVTVKTNDQLYPTVLSAINALVKENGQNGGNRKCTITIANGYIISEQIYLNNQDLNWITIQSENNQAISVNLSSIKTSLNQTSYNFIELNNSKINIKASFNFNVGNLSIVPIQFYIFHLSNSTLNLNECTINNVVCNSYLRIFNSILVIKNSNFVGAGNNFNQGGNGQRGIYSEKSNINMESVNISKFNQGIVSVASIINYTNSSILEMRSYYTQGLGYGCILSGSGSKLTMDNVTIDTCDIGLFPNITNELILSNCKFTNQYDTYYCLKLPGGIRGTITDCTFSTSAVINVRYLVQIEQAGNNITFLRCIMKMGTNSTGNPITFTNSTGVTLEDCTIQASIKGNGGAPISVLCSNASQVLISGGNYRPVEGVKGNANIYATGQQSIVTLRNNVQGTYGADSGGVINVQ